MPAREISVPAPGSYAGAGWVTHLFGYSSLYNLGQDGRPGPNLFRFGASNMWVTSETAMVDEKLQTEALAPLGEMLSRLDRVVRSDGGQLQKILGQMAEALQQSLAS